MTRLRNVYMPAHNTRNKQTSMHLTGFEAASPESQRLQTRALDRAAIGIGDLSLGGVSKNSARSD